MLNLPELTSKASCGKGSCDIWHLKRIIRRIWVCRQAYLCFPSHNRVQPFPGISERQQHALGGPQQVFVIYCPVILCIFIREFRYHNSFLPASGFMICYYKLYTDCPGIVSIPFSLKCLMAVTWLLNCLQSSPLLSIQPSSALFIARTAV